MSSLAGQTVVVIGGSSGIGLATARHARAEGADVVLAARNAERLQRAADEVGAASTAAFDVNDAARLAQFFAELPASIDHILLTGSGPYYAALAELDLDRARKEVAGRLVVPLEIARNAIGKVRAGGTLLFIGGTAGRRPRVGGTLLSPLTAALPELTKVLALEIAPIRVNLIAAGFVDTPLSESLLGDQIDERREQLRRALPIGRVVGADDVAALAIHLMTNTALTGGTYDIDGGQQLVDA